MPTTLSFTHTLPLQLTHYLDLGRYVSLGIPYHTCNATKVARETTVFLFFLFVCFFSKANDNLKSLAELACEYIVSPRSKPVRTFLAASSD